MSDKEFLQWVYERLEQYYEVDARTDYMSKLRAVIASTDENKCTPNVVFGEANK